MPRTSHVIRSADDVSALINQTESTSSKSRWIIVIALGCTFLDGYDFAALGVGSSQIKEQFGPSSALFGTTTAAIAIGALLGALVGGYYVDKIGRMRMLAFDLVFFVVAAIGAALAPDIYWLIVFRFIMGIGVGLDFPVALSFIAEYKGRNQRASALTAWGVMFSLGVIATYWVAIAVHALGGGDHMWRIVVAVGAIPAILVVVARSIFIQESPMWCATSGDLEGAARILRTTYDLDVTAEPAEPAADDSRGRTYSIEKYLQVFSPKYLLRTVLVSTVSMTQSIQFYAVSFYLPLIAVELFSDGFYAATLGSMLMAMVVPAGTILAMRLVDQTGARVLVMVGYVGVALSLLVIGLAFGALPLAFATALICVFQFAHGLGPGTLGMTMSAMSYPTEIRGAGVGVGQASLRVGSIVGFYCFPLLVDSVGLQTTLLFLASVPAAGLIATLVIKWEPRLVDVDAEARVQADAPRSLRE